MVYPANKIVVNARILHGPITGLQRYALELLGRLASEVEQIQPKKPLSRINGVLWEQVALPVQLKGRLLWNPHNSGPLAVKRQVVTMHDVSPLDHPEWFDPLFARWQRFLIPQLVKRAQRIITISNFSKSRLQELCNISEEKITVIPNGVDQRFKPQQEDVISDVREYLKIPSPHYVLCVGTIEPKKNIPRLLKAWKIICKQIPSDVWLVLAGITGNIEVFREERIKDIPSRVYITGHVEDAQLPALYAGALASIYVSLYEGFGLPPLESMATGTPVLTSNLTSLPEVVGDAAITVDPYDEEAIAAALQRIIDDSEIRRCLSQKGMARVVQFSWDKAAILTKQCLLDSVLV
jgi:glycosyltransferase involved in cell wall biosynthesis